MIPKKPVPGVTRDGNRLPERLEIRRDCDSRQTGFIGAARVSENCRYRFYPSLTRVCFTAPHKGSQANWRRGRVEAMNPVSNNRIDKLVQSIAVLIVDDNQYMRKVIRNILVNIGVKNIHEAADGIAGLEAIRMFAPDLVILDWEMPLLNGAELVRIVRSPGVFPVPDVPIIMLTGHVERWRVIEASRLGVNEFLKKPVSGKALLDRIVAILTRPRAMVRLGDYYGPEPRKLFYEPMQKLIAAPPTAPKAEEPGAKLMA
jgi:two-component system, chemotaxis family, chemotaxis protein CheY